MTATKPRVRAASYLSPGMAESLGLSDALDLIEQFRERNGWSRD